MGVETGERHSPLEEKIADFIETSYPTTRNGVKRMYDDLRSFASVRPRIEVIDNELGELEEIAIKEGIGDLRRVGPNRHLPTRLAALKKFEERYRHETVRKLDSSTYVRLLAIAEIVTAQRGQSKGAALHGNKFLAEHAQKAITLIGFYKKLNK